MQGRNRDEDIGRREGGMNSGSQPYTASCVKQTASEEAAVTPGVAWSSVLTQRIGMRAGGWEEAREEEG